MLNTPPQTANAAAMPSNSLAATPLGSAAPAATEIPPRYRPLTFVAFVARKPQTYEGFGGSAGAAVLFALFAHVAAGFRVAVQQHPGAAGGVVDIPLAGGRRRGGGALAFPVEQGGAEGQVAVAGGGGEEGFSGGPCGSRHWSLCLAITARLFRHGCDSRDHHRDHASRRSCRRGKRSRNSLFRGDRGSAAKQISVRPLEAPPVSARSTLRSPGGGDDAGGDPCGNQGLPSGTKNCGASAVSAAHQAVVVGMTADPEPMDTGLGRQAQRPVMETNSHAVEFATR